jgi:Tfp pilus assembly protein PilF
MPHLSEMAKKYAGKATFTGVNVWETKNPTDDSYFANVEEFVKKKGDLMAYNVALDGHEGTMAHTWMEAAGQNGIPAAFVIDQQGKIAWIGHPMGGLDEVVGKVIAGTFDSKAEAEKQAKAHEAQAKMMAKVSPFLNLYRQKKYAEAVTAMDTAFADDPKLEMNYGMLKFMSLAQVDADKANAYAGKLAVLYKDRPSMLNNLAWTMVDDKNPMKGADPNLALDIAQRCVAATKAGDPMEAYNLDTLAFCYYKVGQLDKAISTQEKALKTADATKEFDANTRKEMAGRLDMMKQKKGSGK